jgi:hypothetical protein
MIPMQVTYKNMIYFLRFEAKTLKLVLCSFGTINQKVMIPHPEQLCRHISAMCRDSSTRTEDT